MKIDKILQINLINKLLHPRRYGIFFDISPTLSMFSNVKIQLFVTLKSD
jgi:hypothetical protein